MHYVYGELKRVYLSNKLLDKLPKCWRRLKLGQTNET